MTISVLLRVTPAAVARGQLAGEVEILATGRRSAIRSAADLIAVLSDAADAEATDGLALGAPTADGPAADGPTADGPAADGPTAGPIGSRPALAPLARRDEPPQP